MESYSQKCLWGAICTHYGCPLTVSTDSSCLYWLLSNCLFILLFSPFYQYLWLLLLVLICILIFAW